MLLVDMQRCIGKRAVLKAEAVASSMARASLDAGRRHADSGCLCGLTASSEPAVRRGISSHQGAPRVPTLRHGHPGQDLRPRGLQRALPDAEPGGGRAGHGARQRRAAQVAASCALHLGQGRRPRRGGVHGALHPQRPREGLGPAARGWAARRARPRAGARAAMDAAWDGMAVRAKAGPVLPIQWIHTPKTGAPSG